MLQLFQHAKQYGTGNPIIQIWRNDVGAGLEYWCRMYLTGQQSIEEVASHGFLHSEELLNQKLSDKEFVTRMYQTFLNREPDAEGLQYWLTKLKTGEKTRDNLVYGFTLSREFANVKQAYGLP